VPGGSLRRLSRTLGENTVSAMAQKVGLHWPPPPPLHIRDIFERGETALVLSGGGAKGSFEVGAVKYLYEQGIRPGIICSTSVGSVNGLKLAEGEDDGSDPDPQRGFSGLESIWLGLKQNSDMYVEDSWFKNSPDWIRGAINSQKRSDLDPFTQVMLEFAPPFAQVAISELQDFVDTAKIAHGIYNLQPIRSLAEAKVDRGKVARSGIRLRMATVQLESGNLFYVTELGRLVSDPTEDASVPLVQVDVIDGMIASASIPGYFEMQPLASNWYVDGGVRQVAPVQAAVEMGATVVYVVLASAPICVDSAYNRKG
jgi:predicted acylesterase/phospholipase RssA